MADLLLAIICSSMVSITMRLSSDKIKNGLCQLAACYITCFILAALYIGDTGLFPKHSALPQTMLLGTIGGAVYLAGFVLLQFNIKRSGVVLSSAFMKLGLLVPMVISVFFFGEVPTSFQVIGFAVAIAAMIVMNSEKESSDSKFNIGLILLLLGGGSADAMSKIYDEIGAPELSALFLFYIFFTAFLFCMAIIVKDGLRFELNDIKYGALVGIPNFFSSRFLLSSLDSVKAVIVYPTFSVGTMLAVTLVGVAFFGEKLRKNQWMALLMILAALLLLNV